MTIEQELEKLRKEWKKANREDREFIEKRAKMLLMSKKKKSTFEIGKEVFGKKKGSV